MCIPLLYLSTCVTGLQICLLLSVFQTPQGRGKYTSTAVESEVCTATLPILAGCRVDPLAMGYPCIARS